MKAPCMQVMAGLVPAMHIFKLSLNEGTLAKTAA
jgi:hypothetical protein